MFSWSIIKTIREYVKLWNKKSKFEISLISCPNPLYFDSIKNYLEDRCPVQLFIIDKNQSALSHRSALDLMRLSPALLLRLFPQPLGSLVHIAVKFFKCSLTLGQCIARVLSERGKTWRWLLCRNTCHAKAACTNTNRLAKHLGWLLQKLEHSKQTITSKEMTAILKSVYFKQQ